MNFIYKISLVMGLVSMPCGVLLTNDLGMASKGYVFEAGTSIWDIMGELQEALEDVQTMTVSLTSTINTLDGKTDDLAGTLNAVVQEFTQGIAQLFAKAEEIQQQSSTQIQAVANSLQTIAQQASTQLQETLNSVDQVGTSVEGYLDGIQAAAQILNNFATAAATQSDRLTALLNALEGDQETFESTLDQVRQNGAIVAQMAQDMDAQDAVMNSKLDALTGYYTELSENDAKIFSVVERLETKMATAARLNGQATSVAPVAEPAAARNAQVRFIRNKHVARAGGMIIDEPGLYLLTESLTIDAGVGITIQAHNVTLDLSGFTVQATSDAAVPLSIVRATTVCVKNGTITGGQGVKVEESEGVTLENIIITEPIQEGLQISNTNMATVSCCSVCHGVQGGIAVDAASTKVTIRNSAVSDCQGTGLDLRGHDVVVQDSRLQHNGLHGIAVHEGGNLHLLRTISDHNAAHGIVVDANVACIQVESCRVMGNGAIGCLDSGASCATWMNNLASSNGEADYQNIKAVLITKATSFWHNVYGN